MLEPIHPPEAPDDEVRADLRAAAAHWQAALSRAAAAPMALQTTRRSG
jgi:hypothetical protein